MKGSKYCHKCNQWKVLDDFYNDKYNATGKTSWCKDCANEHHKQYKEANKMSVYDKLELMIKGNYIYDIFEENGEKSMYLEQDGNYVAIHDEGDTINIIWQRGYEVVADKDYKRPVSAFKYIDKILSGRLDNILY